MRMYGYYFAANPASGLTQVRFDAGATKRFKVGESKDFDAGNTFDPGGRLWQLMVRVNW